MNALTKITYWCLDIIFPKYCLGCHTEGSYLCQDCFRSLPVNLSANCFVCGQRSIDGRACDNCRHKTSTALTGILVAADWKDPLLRQIIYEYKYRFVKELVNPLSQLIIDFLKYSRPAGWQTKPINQPVLVPVPLHGRRFAWRGFNQAELLAKKISSELNMTLRADLLIRSRHTLPQRELADEKARAANIKNAFSLSSNLGLAQNNFLKNRIVILLDDICTTGSTFEDCARTLKSLELKEIWGLVIARG